jgi:glycosyltransferase involved in cell wall biosynthesis
MVSVVMPVLDGLPWLVEQLHALAEQRCSHAWEVVVADNGSTDGSLQLARRWCRRLPVWSVVDCSAQSGPGAARNAGVRAASGGRIVFCDADDVVQPGWLQACVDGLAGADVVAGSFDFAVLNGGHRSAPAPAATSQLGFLPAGLASNLAVRREAFEAVGGFAEELSVGEDIDLCWRLQLGGYRFVSVHDAVVARREPTSPTVAFRRGLAYGRSGPRLYRRHRAAGARPAWRESARSWGWLAASAPRLIHSEQRPSWARVAGVRIGRLVGSVEQGVLFP